MKLFLPIFLFSLLSLLGLEARAYAEQDTIIQYTNAVAPEYKVDFVISGDNPSTSFTPNATTAEQASSSNTNAGGTISFPNGKQVEVAETPTSIEDKDGKIYAVGEDGKVTKAAEKTKETQSLAGNMSTREKETSEGKVAFSAYKGQSYAFDTYNPIYENVAEYKNKYEEFGGEKVAVKAIAMGKPDRVSIAFDGGMPVDSIYFLTPAGVRYKAERDNGGYYLNLIGGEANDAQEVYAILPNRQDTTKPSTIGKLIVAAYPRQEKNLMLVPVNGAKVDTAGVLKKINEIYNPVNVYWKINIAENFNNTWDTDKDDALNVTGSKWYTTYTEEMKALKTAYSQANNIDQRTLYMFVMKKAKTDNETSSKTIVGDMPRGKQFGFLFTEKADTATLAKTIAHELGHGYFQLKHPFEMGLNKEQLPYNLMDYDQGVAFNKYQWDLMHDPGIVTGLFQSDTSGQLVVNLEFKGLNVGIAPNRKVIIITNKEEGYSHFYRASNYCISGIIVKDKNNKVVEDYLWKDNDYIDTINKRSITAIGTKITLHYNTNEDNTLVQIYRLSPSASPCMLEYATILYKSGEDIITNNVCWKKLPNSNKENNCSDVDNSGLLLFVNGYEPSIKDLGSNPLNPLSPAFDYFASRLLILASDILVDKNIQDSITAICKRMEKEKSLQLSQINFDPLSMLGGRDISEDVGNALSAYMKSIMISIIEQMQKGKDYREALSQLAQIVSEVIQTKSMLQNYLPMIFKNQAKTQGGAVYWEGIDDVFKGKIGYKVAGYLNGDAHVSTASNESGFDSRVSNGQDNTKALIEQMKSGSLGIIDLENPIDVVCHSMGYAHALGAIKVLQDIGLKIGALYCLAPEGAQFTEKTAGCIDVLSKIDIKEQFGSDEIGHSILKKDYIAPQHPVPGATRYYHALENIEGWGFWRAHTLGGAFLKEFNIKKNGIFVPVIIQRK